MKAALLAISLAAFLAVLEVELAPIIAGRERQGVA